MRQLNYFDRQKIERVLSEGGSARAAAETLGCDVSTVYREIQRAGGRPYEAISGQARANLNKRDRSQKIGRAKAGDNYERILACMEEYPQLNKNQISKKLGMSHVTVGKYVDRIREEQDRKSEETFRTQERRWPKFKRLGHCREGLRG